MELIRTYEEYDRAIPRLGRLVRNTREDHYGFEFKTLKNEGKHIANNVRAGFPADKAGLRDGDYILEVNGESIDSIEHDAVVNKISAYPKQVDLLVVGDLNAYLSYMYYKENKKRFSSRKLVTLDNTEPYSSINGLSTLTLNRAVSSENCKLIFVLF